MDLWHIFAAVTAGLTSAASVIAAFVSLNTRAALAELEVRIIDRLAAHTATEIKKCAKAHTSELELLALAISDAGANGRAHLKGAHTDA